MARVAIERAWAAGLFDGEGSVFVARRVARPNFVGLNIALSMTDEDSVVRFAEIVGTPPCKSVARLTDSGRTVYRTASQSPTVVREALRRMWPHLGIAKRIQSCEALATRSIYEKYQKPKNLSEGASARWRV